MTGGNNHHLMNEEENDEENNNNEEYNESLPVEEREQYRFKNGAIYKGQWKGTMRHGFGV
jgi:hypothetical protein